MRALVKCAALAVILAVPNLEAGDIRSRVSLDSDWRFARGDPPGAAGPVENAPCAQAQFDDSNWRRLDVPHDWAIEGPFDQSLPGETGKLPWAGVGWYRKRFHIPVESRGSLVHADFDGAMSHADVWLNGHFVGGWPSGYTSFRLDLTPFARPGAENILAVRLENPPESSRWYPGAGIYRNVWLVTEGPVHVAHWGIAVTTTRVSAESATVVVSAVVDNNTPAKACAMVSTGIFELDEDGRAGSAPVATGSPRIVSIPPGGEASCTESIRIGRPRLWNLGNRFRYVAVTTILESGAVIDRVETPFGIRTIAFDPDRGFLLNGEHIAIRGVCDHHDLGALGAAINASALARKIRLLQEMGCNAIRTSHNPPAPELLELCDRMGMLVMDEAFDAWTLAKKPNDYHLLFADWHERDLRAMVRRDRNHPCVVLWSIGNEIPEQTIQPLGSRLARQLSGIVHEEDGTRPTVSAFSEIASGYNGMQLAVGVAGYNYRPKEYPRFHALNPAIPLVASETASCVSTRGFYTFPVSGNLSEGMGHLQVSSYDLVAPPWATSPDREFLGLDQAPFNAGEFVWTGFDYLGEPTPYGRPPSFLLGFKDPAEHARMEAIARDLEKVPVSSRSSYFGILDLAGLKKDRFYIYQARWRTDLPMAHLLPHWTWPERVGLVTPVHVYTSGDAAELFLNGRSLGRKIKAALDYRIRWDDVRYEPGELKVVAYRDGRPWATDIERTAGPAAVIGLSPGRSTLSADGADLAYVTVRINDRDGNLVPRAMNRVRFRIAGPGDVIAVDNGDPTSLAPFQATERDAFNGLCIAIVRSRRGAAGRIFLTAESDSLAPATVEIETSPALMPSVSAAQAPD